MTYEPAKGFAVWILVTWWGGVVNVRRPPPGWLKTRAPRGTNGGRRARKAAAVVGKCLLTPELTGEGKEVASGVAGGGQSETFSTDAKISRKQPRWPMRVVQRPFGLEPCGSSDRATGQKQSVRDAVKMLPKGP